MRFFVLIIWLILMTSASAQPASQDAKSYALTLLNQARAALGDTNIQTLSASGKIRRPTKYAVVTAPDKVQEKQKTLISKVEFDFEFPDKFRLREKGHTIYDTSFDSLQIINSKETWVYPIPVAPSTPDNRRVVNADEVEQNLARQLQAVKVSISRFTLGWLLRSLPSWPFEFNYGGIDSTEVGTPDVITAQDSDGYKTLLTLDRQTHLPLALIETIVAPHREPVLVSVGSFDRRYTRATFARARQERIARAKPPQPVAVEMRMSEHRIVNGLKLPTKILTFHNGQLVEEIEITNFAINRSINPQKFEEKRPR